MNVTPMGVAELALAHLVLSLWALMLGAAISIPLGIAASRRPWLERAALAVASVIQTVPGLALLAVMVPALAALSTLLSPSGLDVPSIGPLPAVLGLTLYSLLPMLRNTVVGISEVDEGVVEAARGVGMTDAQRLRFVELPLAAPVIIAGLRTAAVWTVGMATLATPVGASSLGDLIFAGLQTRSNSAVIAGCLASAALALTLDGLIRALGRGIATRRRARWIGPAAILALACLYALVSPFVSADNDEMRVQIGAKPFTEQYVLAEVLARTVEQETGRSTNTIHSLGSNVAFDALVAGDLDVYVEYTGTLWTAIMERDEAPPERAELTRQVTEWLLAEHGIVVAAELGFENAYALAVRAPGDGGPRIERISELGPLATNLSVGGDYELFQRSEWRSITNTYALHFREQRTMDPTLLYEAIVARDVDVIGAYTTDGRIAGYDLRVLEDDRDAIPPYDAVILVSRDLAASAPDVVTGLATLDGTIDADRMRALNHAVDVDGRSPEDVATELRPE